MIKVLGQPMVIRRYRRGERFFHQRDHGPIAVTASIDRIGGSQRAYLEVIGRDEAGTQIYVSAECHDLRDAEVMVLAALDRRGLRAWADRLMGGAA